MTDHTHGSAQLGDAAHKVTSAVGGTVSGALDATGSVAKTALGVTGGAARKVAALTDKGPMAGFKKFISRGSMIDMAVGVVMGSAVTSVVNSIVSNLISPLIGMIGGVPDMSGLLTVTFNNSTISFGAIIDAIINFLLIGVAVYFCVILPINKLRDVMMAPDGAEAGKDAHAGRAVTTDVADVADVADAAAKAPATKTDAAEQEDGYISGDDAGGDANTGIGARSAPDAPAVPSPEEQTLTLLREIRDELRRANGESACAGTRSPSPRLS